MLSDMIKALITTKTADEVETAYKNLESIGINVWAALLIAKEMLDE